MNEPVWPELFDTFVALEVLIMSDDMMKIFESGCPDYTVPFDRWEVRLPGEDRTLVITDVWSSIIPPNTSNSIIFPREDPELKIREPT